MSDRQDGVEAGRTNWKLQRSQDPDGRRDLMKMRKQRSTGSQGTVAQWAVQLRNTSGGKVHGPP